MPPSSPPVIFTPPAGGAPPSAPSEVFDPETALSTERVLESVTLSGATGLGAAALNLTHLVTGTYGGKKCFGGTAAEPRIGWDGTRWEIEPAGGGAAYIAGAGAVPADGTWTNISLTGTIVGVYTAPVAGFAAPPEITA